MNRVQKQQSQYRFDQLIEENNRLTRGGIHWIIQRRKNKNTPWLDFSVGGHKREAIERYEAKHDFTVTYAENKKRGLVRCIKVREI